MRRKVKEFQLVCGLDPASQFVHSGRAAGFRRGIMDVIGT
jgi:hypothetical protein